MQDAHGNDPRFVQYYARESASVRAAERATGIMAAVLRFRRERGLPIEELEIADIGCNAGTQARVWLEQGHRVNGVDISQDLIAIAARRNASFGKQASFEIGSATDLPWQSNRFDVCLLPELLEHVEDWKSCLTEAVRVLRPSGTLYLSTTNVLCPIQQEFNLPFYSWYPDPIKKRLVQLTIDKFPQLANYAKYPAVNWFSPRSLSRFLEGMDVVAADRFDLIDLQSQSVPRRLIIHILRRSPALRILGHILTPSTVLVGAKQ